MTIGGASTKESGLGLQVLESLHMAPSFVLTARGRSHAGDTELRVSRKVFRTADLPTAVSFKQPLLALVIFELIRLKPRSSELTSLSQALCVTEVFLHMVYVEAELLPGTHSCHKSGSTQFSWRATKGSSARRHKSSFGYAGCSGVSPPPRAETQCSLHGARCGCSGCPRRRSPCHNRITRVSGHPREKATRLSEPKNKSNRHAVVHQQVG